MTTVRVEGPGLVKRRYFPSTRTILLVRFDPGTADDYEVDEIRNELTPSPEWAQRLRDRQAILIGQQAERGPQVVPTDVARQAILEATRNIAFSVSRVPRRDGLSRYLDVVPSRSTRKLNSARLADELELELDWKAFPFDARLVRAILILHYEGTVTASDYGIGIDTPLSRQSIVSARGPNLRFIGLADEIQDGHSRDGDTLVIKARDLTQLLIDTAVPKTFAVTVKPGATVSQLVRNIMDTTPTGQLIRGPFLRTSTGVDVPLDVRRYPRLAFSPKELHRVNGTEQAPTATFVPSIPKQSGAQQLSYWDLITDLCVSHELRPSVELDRLILYDPRVMFRRNPGQTLQEIAANQNFPSQHRKDVGDTRTVREMVFGYNLSSLAFGRKLGRIKAPTIEVIGYDPDAAISSRRRIVERFPREPLANQVDPTGEVAEEKIFPVQMPGIVDRAALRKIAEQVYEEIARQEMSVVLETEELASFSDAPNFDPNSDPDLLSLRFADPIKISVASSVAQTTRLYALSELNRMVSRSKRTAEAAGSKPELTDAIGFLVAQGWAEKDARQMVRLLQIANLPSEFRLISATFSWNTQDGFTIAIDAKAYIQVRIDRADADRSVGGTRGSLEEGIG